MRSPSPYPILDPDLARRTRAGHWTLFLINTILLVPAVFGTMVLWQFARESKTSLRTLVDLEMLVISLPTISGILAWAALGLLLTKPSFPRWHLGSWAFVLLFGLSSIPGGLLMMANLGEMPVYLGLSAFVICLGATASWISIRNMRLAWHSLRRSRNLSGPAPSRS
ncbi:hypothetical protein [Luteolibacter luteus]|uniref:Uncharacterized protein n=1 Tax=Luteolibacter luteus TaxID=2728835 RepID=A0A858RD17_9BACT|nr:hypothetical protein [Luteolibacter luteus]QJE94936.1 hypothetical protein HHL09_03800 [Luteolibacter luteus]